MAQDTNGTKANLNRNTKTQKRVRFRNWVFTLNNYTASDIGTLTQPNNENIYKYIFQEETGESGTPHLQGLLCYTNPVGFSALKKLIPKAHVEPCKNKNASIQYCSKEETRTGEIYNNLKTLKKKIKNKEEEIKNDDLPGFIAGTPNKHMRFLLAYDMAADLNDIFDKIPFLMNMKNIEIENKHIEKHGVNFEDEEM